MQINYQSIILRDMRESDIDDDIRWRTVETAWGDWDAPWEPITIDPEKYRAEQLEWIACRKPDHRLSLEIETVDGVHIGAVNTYCIDEDFDWRELTAEEDRQKANWAVGIDINESAYWSRGWGTQALTAFVRYHLEAGYTDLYTQTWSGNERMVRLAEKLGFRECRRKKGIREVRGGTYDGLTFKLDRDAFAAHCERVACAPLRPSQAAAVAEKFGDYVTEYDCLHFGEGCLTLGAWRGSELAGFLSLLPQRLPPPLEDRRDAFIDAIEVDAALRRRGVARALLSHAERWAAGHGYGQIRAWSSQDKEAAIAMWYALGYTVCPAHMAGEDLCPDGSGLPPLGCYAAKRLKGEV